MKYFLTQVQQIRNIFTIIPNKTVLFLETQKKSLELVSQIPHISE